MVIYRYASSIEETDTKVSDVERLLGLLEQEYSYTVEDRGREHTPRFVITFTLCTHPNPKSESW